MKLAILLSTLAVAAGFAPQSQPRQMTSLSMSELKTGTVKWYVSRVTSKVNNFHIRGTFNQFTSSSYSI